MSENKETKHEVTNEQILEHLKEIEIAQGCIANGINTLFSVMIERKEQLKLSKSEMEMIRHGEVALACLTDHMADISGMNEELNRREKERQAEVRDRGYGYIDGFMFLNDSPNFSNEARIKKESEQKRDKEHPEFIKEFETIRRQKNEI